MIKTGEQHVRTLKDGRQVYLNGGIVRDVTTHPAFRNAVASVGKLYDFQSRPANLDLMTFRTPDGKGRANRIWQLPGSYAELVERRKALEAWTELHGGFLGRAPDHVASCIAGMYMGRDVFEEYNKECAGALAEYYRHARDNELYLTYVIINPQADRSKAAHEQADEFLTAGVVDEDSEGLTIRGAKMLATGGIMANEVFVTCIQPLQPGDEKYAVSFTVPMNARGLKILSRKSYEEHAPSIYDNPLAHRFDENDAVLYFDDVKVPWDRVFINQDTQMCLKQFHATPAHVYQNYQAQIRLMVKMQFLVGVARRICETIGTVGMPPVAEKLGHMAAQTAMVEGLVYGMESGGGEYNGYYVPDRNLMYTAQVLTQQLYPEFITAMRELAGGGLIMLPSSAEDFRDPELARLICATQKSPVGSPEQKVKFMKLAWDAVGSEFAGRHTQYEMFYAGAQFVTRAHAFRTYDWDRAAALVDSVLERYSLDDVIGDRRIAAE